MESFPLNCRIWHITLSLTSTTLGSNYGRGPVNSLTNGLQRRYTQCLGTPSPENNLIIEFSKPFARINIEDIKTESISASQSGSLDIAGRGEDGTRNQTRERTQYTSMEPKNNHLGCQSEKAQSPNASAPICPAQGLNTEPSGTITLKMQTAVLPLCLGESSVFLPVHLQLPTGPQGPGSTPFLLPSHGPGSLPLVLEQQVFQRFNSQFLPQGVLCSAPPPQQNRMLPQNCQPSLNSSIPLRQPSPVEQKGVEQEPGLGTQEGLAGFAAFPQDLFTTHNSFTQFACQMAGPNSTQAFGPSLVSPPPSFPLPYACSSPLAPLVPPPTLLVPFPIVVPLPVPVPIPIPIPIPLRPKVEVQEPRSTAAVSTQTCDGMFRPVYLHTSDSEGAALDLSTTAGPSRLKQEASAPQDSPLDLSVAYHVHKPLVQVEQPDAKQPVKRPALSLDVLPQRRRGQNLDSEFPDGLTSPELSRHRNWLMDGRCSHETKYGAELRNYEIVSASQTAKVIVAVKDSIPTIFRGKLKDLVGVPTGTFPSQQHMEQSALVWQHCSPGLSTQSNTGHHLHPRRGAPHNRTVKLKKVRSQEMHILPVKKKRFTAFLHGE